MNIRLMDTDKPTGVVGFLPMEGGDAVSGGGGEGRNVSQNSGSEELQQNLAGAVPAVTEPLPEDVLSEEDLRNMDIVYNSNLIIQRLGNAKGGRLDAAKAINNAVERDNALYTLAVQARKCSIAEAISNETLRNCALHAIAINRREFLHECIKAANGIKNDDQKKINVLCLLATFCRRQKDHIHLRTIIEAIKNLDCNRASRICWIIIEGRAQFLCLLEAARQLEEQDQKNKAAIAIAQRLSQDGNSLVEDFSLENFNDLYGFASNGEYSLNPDDKIKKTVISKILENGMMHYELRKQIFSSIYESLLDDNSKKELLWLIANNTNLTQDFRKEVVNNFDLDDIFKKDLESQIEKNVDTVRLSNQKVVPPLLVPQKS